LWWQVESIDPGDEFPVRVVDESGDRGGFRLHTLPRENEFLGYADGYSPSYTPGEPVVVPAGVRVGQRRRHRCRDFGTYVVEENPKWPGKFQRRWDSNGSPSSGIPFSADELASDELVTDTPAPTPAEPAQQSTKPVTGRSAPGTSPSTSSTDAGAAAAIPAAPLREVFAGGSWLDFDKFLAGSDEAEPFDAYKRRRVNGVEVAAAVETGVTIVGEYMGSCDVEHAGFGSDKWQAAMMAARDAVARKAPFPASPGGSSHSMLWGGIIDIRGGR